MEFTQEKNFCPECGSIPQRVEDFDLHQVYYVCPNIDCGMERI